MAVTAWQGYTLLAVGRQRVTVAYDAAALTVSIALNFALIPALGYMGAVLAALAASLLDTVFSLIAVGRFVGVTPDLGRLSSLLAANAALGASLWLLLQLGWPWLPALLLSGAIYPCWLLLFHFTNPAELRLLLPSRAAPLNAASGVEA
jgi:O-antigen/teichoic acid export membrane protein